MPSPDPAERTDRAARPRPDAERERESAATRPGAEEPEAQVDETSEESFPASDPPGWSRTHAGSPEPDDDDSRR